MSLAAMRATLLDDQRALLRQQLATMPRARRREAEPVMVAISRRVIDAIPDDDVRACFEKETANGS